MTVLVRLFHSIKEVDAVKQNMSKTAAVCTAILDMLINIGAIYLAILILDYKKHVFTGTTIAVSTICAFVTIIVYFASDMYSSAVLDKLHKVLLKLAGAQLFVLSTGIIVIGMFFSARTEYYKLAFLSVALSFCALALKTVLITKIAHKVRTDAESKKTVLLVGNGKSALEYKKQLEDNPHYGYEVIGCVADIQVDELEWLGAYGDLKDVLDRENPDEVVIALTLGEEHMIQALVDVCDTAGIRVSIVPSIYRYFKSKCQVDMVGSLPVINTRDIPLDNPANAAIKRIMDIIISLVVIILTSPIMLLAAIGVRISSKGPIIFKQKRVGKNNKIFTMYKFRSMRVNDQETTGWTTPEDTRKTRFGTFMRKTGIDELPQFFNVLFGSMSIVGPRPELPTFVEQYSKSVPLYKVKHQVKPGITGLAQIYGFRGDTSIEGRIEMDIKYIENWSLFNDIKILVVTPFKMFNRNEKYVK